MNKEFTVGTGVVRSQTNMHGTVLKLCTDFALHIQGFISSVDHFDGRIEIDAVAFTGCSAAVMTSGGVEARKH